MTIKNLNLNQFYVYTGWSGATYIFHNKDEYNSLISILETLELGEVVFYTDYTDEDLMLVGCDSEYIKIYRCKTNKFGFILRNHLKTKMKKL